MNLDDQIPLTNPHRSSISLLIYGEYWSVDPCLDSSDIFRVGVGDSTGATGMNVRIQNMSNDTLSLRPDAIPQLVHT